MSLLYANCPRCGTQQITFEIQSFNAAPVEPIELSKPPVWQKYYELFCICRACRKGTVFILRYKNEISSKTTVRSIMLEHATANDHMEVVSFLNLRDNNIKKSPEYLPDNIAACFNESATCYAVECYNAAGTMFRLCVDLATAPKLPDPEDKTGSQPNSRQRRDLGLRLVWMFEQGLLPRDLERLATCVREDGNDAAHRGILDKADVEDLLDFTEALLERIITEPERIRLAEERRATRRKPPAA